MAFDSKEESNMLDGPKALVQERDACGVGFIANTQSGGKFTGQDIVRVPECSSHHLRLVQKL